MRAPPRSSDPKVQALVNNSTIRVEMLGRELEPFLKLVRLFSRSFCTFDLLTPNWFMILAKSLS